jgi:ferredoxin, 2Fe-2S
MTSVTFIVADGESLTLDIASGVSVMQAATRAGIRGIEAICGGAAVCATCHVYVAEEWLGRLAVPSMNEAKALDCVVDPDESSRLACQIVVHDNLDGLVVRVPLTQR